MPDRESPEQRRVDERPPPATEPRTDETDEAEETERTELTDVEETEVAFEPRIWSVVSHLSLFVLPILGPLLVLGLQETILGKRSELVTFHGKQAVVWQVATIIVGIATIGIGGLIMGIIALYATLQAWRGDYYPYPLIGTYANRAL